MKDYAKGRVTCDHYEGTRVYAYSMWQPLRKDLIEDCIREACAEAYSDGRKAERRRAVRLAEKYADEGWSLNQLRQAILNPKRRGGK